MNFHSQAGYLRYATFSLNLYMVLNDTHNTDKVRTVNTVAVSLYP